MTAVEELVGGLDLHCAAGWAPGFDFTRPEVLVAQMDQAGITHAVLGPIGYWAAVGNEDADEALARWCARWPGRFARWVTVNPWYRDAPARLAAAMTPDVVGLKLMPAVQGFSLLQLPLVEPLLQVVEEAGKPVYVVTGVPVASEPFQLAELARRFPRLTFVMGRSGRTDFAMDLLPALRAVPNLLAETAYNGAALIRELSDTLGADRVVFASDAPFNDLDLEVSRLGRAGLDQSTHRAVFGDTARRLIGKGSL